MEMKSCDWASADAVTISAKTMVMEVIIRTPKLYAKLVMDSRVSAILAVNLDPPHALAFPRFNGDVGFTSPPPKSFPQQIIFQL